MIPLSQTICLGLSHRTAPVALRERISQALPRAQPLAESLPERFSALTELVVLATCNRIELYASVGEKCSDPRQLLVDYVNEFYPIEDTTSFGEYLYFYRGKQVIEHLARVASGLDSLVLGEPQILGQVTDAYMQGVEAQSIGSALGVLFRGAIRIGKRSRSETDISSNPASISSVSISLARSVVDDLQESHVLVVGLGEMGQLALSALRKRGVNKISLANRTRQRAEALFGEWEGTIYDIEELPLALARADVVITASAASQTLIGANLMKNVMRKRENRDLVLIDIAVPRDVDPRVAGISGVHLFNVDDLRGTLDEALAAREREIPRVEAIIAEEMAALDAEFRRLTIKPLIVDLRQKAEAIRQQELERTLRYLGDDVDPETLKHVRHLSRSLVNKLLHEPTQRLREKATNGQSEEIAAAVRHLFNLEDSPKG